MLIYYERARSEDQQRSKSKHQSVYKKLVGWRVHDTQTDMLPGIPGSARCVQRFDDSLNSAIHITYHISLRSSSMSKPRDPLLKVFFCFDISLHTLTSVIKWAAEEFDYSSSSANKCTELESGGHALQVDALIFTNDPSAGSPTETLLRLLLPLNDQVRTTSQQSGSLAGSQ
jgi:hypothetical protein